MQQLRQEYLEGLSRSTGTFPEHTSRWTGVLDAVDRTDICLAQLTYRFVERWDVQTTCQLTQADKPTALDYQKDIGVAKVWNRRGSTQTVLHEFRLDICERFQVPHRVKDNNDMETLRRRSVEGHCVNVVGNLREDSLSPPKTRWEWPQMFLGRAQRFLTKTRLRYCIRGKALLYGKPARECD